jgi:hypothetical protein
MIIPKKLGVSADFGGEVTVKRPSPLPLMPDFSILRIMNSDNYYR